MSGPDGNCFLGPHNVSLGPQVELYNRTVLDTYKVAGAMYTELDRGIQTVIDALQETQMWENTVLIFVSDNGGPLDHCTNMPLRGGKHTFFEGVSLPTPSLSPHDSVQIYSKFTPKFTPNILTIPLIFNKVS
jgi:hypothetical protein